MNTERRRDQRVPLSTSFSESDPRTTTPVADLSRTGARVIGGPMHPIGAHIELCFVAFPDDPLPFSHRGRVIRHLRQTDAMGRVHDAMGVEFDPLPTAVARQLDAILERATTTEQRRRRRSRRLMLENTDLDAHDLRTRILSK